MTGGRKQGHLGSSAVQCSAVQRCSSAALGLLGGQAQAQAQAQAGLSDRSPKAGAKARVVKERIGQHQHTRDMGGAGMASYIIV